jgi:plastocyanin
MTITAEEPRQEQSLPEPARRAGGWRVTGIAMLALLALLMSACGSSSTSATATTSAHPTTTTGASSSSASTKAATSLTIVIKNYAFHPDKAVVAPGAHLVIENEDSVTHTFTSTTGAFNTGAGGKAWWRCRNGVVGSNRRGTRPSMELQTRVALPFFWQ